MRTKLTRLYNIEIKKGRCRGLTQWYVKLKFKNGRTFMHSEYYRNEIYAQRAGEKLYQALKKGY